MLNRITLIIALFCVTGLMAQQGKSDVLDAASFKKEITAKKVVQLIDVRTPEEFAAGHIAHAKNINFMAEDFKKQIAKLDKSKPVYVYCQAGGRSAKAAKIFLEAGFTEVHDLKGGYGAWKE